MMPPGQRIGRLALALILVLAPLFAPLAQTEDGADGQSAPADPSLPAEGGLFDLSGFDAATIDVSRLRSTAAYRSAFGYYLASASGRPLSGKVIWQDATVGVPTTVTLDLDQWPEAEKLGFFLIPDGATRNQNLRVLDAVAFKIVDGGWTVVNEGAELAGRNAPVYFTDQRLNVDRRQQAKIDTAAGTLGWSERPAADGANFGDVKARLSVTTQTRPPLPLAAAPADPSAEEADPGTAPADEADGSAAPAPLPPSDLPLRGEDDQAGGDDQMTAYDIEGVDSIRLDLRAYPSNSRYRSTFGYYLTDENGRPYRGRVIWADVTSADVTRSLEINRRLLGKAEGFGFFIIPDGGALNPALADGDAVGLAEYLGEWTVVRKGVSLNSAGLPAYLSDPRWNADGIDHAIDGDAPGNLNWEDEFQGGDRSYDDVNIDVALTFDRGAGDITTIPPLTPPDAADSAEPTAPVAPTAPLIAQEDDVPAQPDLEADDAGPVAEAEAAPPPAPPTETAAVPEQAENLEPFWGEPVFSGYGEVELSAFPADLQFERQSDEWLQQSVAGSIQYAQDAGARGETLLELFGRYDQTDDQRSYIDIQRAHVAYFGDVVSLTAGVLTETWGVLELENVVDIVNQRNIVEDFRADAKLGQPGIKLGLPVFAFGQADIYYLPFPRRRPFAGEDGRFQFALPIDDVDAFYDSAAEDDAERWGQQGAARLQVLLGDLEAAISHFYGTSRDPRFDVVLDGATPIALSPTYDQINQSAIELRALTAGNILKAEVFRRTGEDPFEEVDAFYGLGTGIEREFVRLFASDLGLTLFGEYYYDNRDFSADAVAPASLDNDIFIGGRLAFNDLADSSLLLSSTLDLDTQATLITLELQRRIGEALQVTLRGDAFIDVEDDPGLTAFKDDHRIQARIRYYY